MKCRSCWNEQTKVVDSRIIEEWQTIRRRRECLECSSRFTTFERIGFTDFFVVKKDGTRELYDRSKIKKALALAFAKRQIEPKQIDDIILSLESQWFGQGKEISSKKIGDAILGELKDIDVVAYIRFASVYKKFNSLDDFKDIIDSY